MSDTDVVARQYELAGRELEVFDGDFTSLGRLVRKLDSLWSAMSEGDDDRRRALRRLWGVLEEVYAVALDDDRAQLNPEEQHLVETTVKELRQLVDPMGGG